MKKIIFALLVFLTSTSAIAEWTRVAGGTDGSDVYMDLDTVRRNGNKVKLWTLQNFKPLAGKTKPKFLSNKSYWEFDCKEELGRIPGIKIFSGKKGSGSIVASNHNPNEAWEPIIPDSIGQIIFDTGCDETIGTHKWTLIKEEKPDANKAILRTYIDQPSIQRKEGFISLWILFDLRSVDHDDGNFSLKKHGEYDCTKKQMRHFGSKFYLANMGVGKNDSDTIITPWEPIETGSTASDILKIICV